MAPPEPAAPVRACNTVAAIEVRDMANDYEILRKANLADDLFRGGEDGAAWEHEEAERDWALEADVPAFVKPAPPDPAETPVARRVAGGEPASLVKSLTPPVPSGRRWAQALADLAGNPALESIGALGVCPVDPGRDATSVTIDLAQWLAQYVEQPALLVEAHLGPSRHASALAAPNVGIKDALIRKDSIDSWVQDTFNPKLKALPAGGTFSDLDLATVAAELPRLISALQKRYNSMLVELPAVLSPSFARLPVAALVDAIILVTDSRSAERRTLQRAAEGLRQAKVPLAATILLAKQRISVHRGRGPRIQV
jgi:Mrp family chromosome partitioning ATPase